MRKLLTVSLAFLLLLGALAGCTVVPTATVAPTSVVPTTTVAPSAAPTPTPVVDPDYKLVTGACSYPYHEPSAVAGGNRYTVAGVSASGVYNNQPNYQPEKAIDDRSDTIWASDLSANPWIVLDLGDIKPIGRVEVYARTDGDNPGERCYLKIEAASTSDFSDAVTLGELGRYTYDAVKPWIVNADASYRYIRLMRTQDKSHFTISEIHVFDTPAALADTTVQPVRDDAQMLVSRCGKTLGIDTTGAICLYSYDFRDLQRWVVTLGDGTAVLRNSATGQYLCSEGGKLALHDYYSACAVWYTESVTDAGWVFLRDARGRILMNTDGVLTVDDYYGKTPSAAWWMICPAYTLEIPKGDASYMKNRYGVMYHLIPTSDDYRTMSENVDTEAIAEQLKNAGVGYFQLALGQCTGYYNSYNATYASIVKKENRTTANRFTSDNIPERFAESLSKRDIDLMFYIPTEPSDPKAFGMDPATKISTRDSAMLWSLCLREWSLHYGTAVKGWWVDGGYSTVVKDEMIFKILANGLKAGNPQAAIAFNPGVVVLEWAESDEYTCGETDFPFGEDRDDTDKSMWVTPENYPIESKQWYELTFLNLGWCDNTFPRSGLYRGEAWGSLVKTVLSQGGSICLDVSYDRSNGYTIQSKLYDILLKIKAAQ